MLRQQYGFKVCTADNLKYLIFLQMQGFKRQKDFIKQRHMKDLKWAATTLKIEDKNRRQSFRDCFQPALMHIFFYIVQI